jgi:hypothetical protein
MNTKSFLLRKQAITACLLGALLAAASARALRYSADAMLIASLATFLGCVVLLVGIVFYSQIHPAFARGRISIVLLMWVPLWSILVLIASLLAAYVLIKTGFLLNGSEFEWPRRQAKDWDFAFATAVGAKVLGWWCGLSLLFVPLINSKPPLHVSAVVMLVAGCLFCLGGFVVHSFLLN